MLCHVLIIVIKTDNNLIYFLFSFNYLEKVYRNLQPTSPASDQTWQPFQSSALTWPKRLDII